MKRELPVIDYNFNGIHEFIDPNEDIFVNIEDLVNECAQHPAKYAFYGSLHIDYLNEQERCQERLNLYEAEQELEMRNRILARYGDKERITEAKMEAEFLRDEQWRDLKCSLDVATTNTRRLEVIKRAFEQRSQQLWNCCSMRRKEADNFLGNNN